MTPITYCAFNLFFALLILALTIDLMSLQQMDKLIYCFDKFYHNWHLKLDLYSNAFFIALSHAHCCF